MTIKQIRSWPYEEKCNVIAAACGRCTCKTYQKPGDWETAVCDGCGQNPFFADHAVPQYTANLNAMSEAEQVLKRDMNGLWYPYVAFLHEFAHGLGEGASAVQRADAFIAVVAAKLVPERLAKRQKQNNQVDRP